MANNIFQQVNMNAGDVRKSYNWYREQVTSLGRNMSGTQLLRNEKFLTDLKNRILSQQSYLRQLDRIGSFEADDETGYFFKEMKDMVNDITVYFGEEPMGDEKTSILEKQKFDAKFEKDY